MSIFQLMGLIQDEKKALKLFQRIRWKDGLLCRRCGTFDAGQKQGKTLGGFQKYQCCCGHVFSDTSGTVLHRKQVKLQHFFFALYEISQNKSVTSIGPGEKLEIHQKKAWRFLKILREYCQNLLNPY